MTHAVAAAQTDPLVELQPLQPVPGSHTGPLFALRPSEQTGIVTTNPYSDPRMWSDLYHEFEVGEIGTGVAIGDYDGDGRPDVFVVSKTESCRLFRNLGGFRFEDVSAKAGILQDGAAAQIWKQGVTFADVNNDGRLDLYVCRFGAPNLLYVNQGDGTFKEMAHAYGLDVNDASAMAAFCDYDRDGWLDVYIVTNLLDAGRGPNGQRDYLFHNNRDGTFTDVSARAGLSGEGQGHSAIWWDYDGDGWPDLYVANDFAAPDKLYHNNRDGTFTDVIDSVVPHMPYSAMGSDVADLNNDGWMDLMVADMAATTHEKDQRGMVTARAQTTEVPDSFNGAPQFPRNVVYLNTGTGRCLEAAELTGLAATDWTWSPRFEDFDNDGRVDLFVTNGMHRESANIDLLSRVMRSETAAARIGVMKQSPPFAETHLAYRNRGDLRFEEVGHAWGVDQKGVSFGSATGDLNGDGNLDLVYANYQSGVTVLQNQESESHRVVIALRGTRSNRFGIGATVRLESASGPQLRQIALARGVLSSSEPIAHFGLGRDTEIQQLTIAWPSGIIQRLSHLAVDQRITVTEPDAETIHPRPLPANASGEPQFSENGAAVGLALTAPEPPLEENATQRFLPVRLGRRGPAIAIADVDHDGFDDVLFGGTPSRPATLQLGQKTGAFAASSGAQVPGASVDDGPALVFASGADAQTWVLLTKGGAGFPEGAPEYQPRLFRYDGTNGFAPLPAATLPALATSVGAVACADFDHDGRLDLFVGGRVNPGAYPEPARSALLVNRGGRFEDVTDQIAPALRNVGLVTGALWSDVDGDGWLDLLVTLDWGGVKYFHNTSGERFEDWSEKAGFAAAGTGWWTGIAAADFNGDGRIDYAVGNVGLNTPYHADPTHPALLFSVDLNGEEDPPTLIEAYYEGGMLYPWRSRHDLATAIPSLLSRYPRNDLYARATLEEILGHDTLAKARRFAATELRSGVFLSHPDGTFRFEPLPRIAQIAPFQGIAAGDFDGDGKADIYAVQNSYAPIPAVGRFDGGLSQLLRGDDHGHFIAVPPTESGLVVPGDAKALAVFDANADGWPDFLVSRNNDTALAFRNRHVSGRCSIGLRLHGPANNPTGIGARIEVVRADGSKTVAEVYAGAGYASQSSAECFIGASASNAVRKIVVHWPDGATREYPVPPDAKTVTLDR